MNAETAVIAYFNFRTIENLGYIKYGNFKKLISFVLDCNNDYYIRKLFLNLIEKGYIKKKRNIKKSYIYIYNRNPAIKIKSKPIDPNIFTISWD